MTAGSASSPHRIRHTNSMADTCATPKKCAWIALRRSYAHRRHSPHAITETQTAILFVALETSNDKQQIHQPLSIADTARCVFLPSFYTTNSTPSQHRTINSGEAALFTHFNSVKSASASSCSKTRTPGLNGKD